MKQTPSFSTDKVRAAGERLGLRLIVAAVALAVLAGCGTKKNQPHTTSAWASSYCSALSDWLTTVDSISRGFLNEPIQSTTLDIRDLEEVTREISQAGSTLTDALARAGRPETGGASQVETTIRTLSSSVRAHSDAARRAAKSTDRSALAGFRRLQAVTGSVDALLTEILSADAKIRTQDPTLGRALDSSSACRKFHSDVKRGTRRGNQ